jgi:hypothetical protein
VRGAAGRLCRFIGCYEARADKRRAPRASTRAWGRSACTELNRLDLFNLSYNQQHVRRALRKGEWMAITEDDAREYQIALTRILTDHGLSWIVEQANERIALGKTVSKRVFESGPILEMVPGETRRGRRRTAEFLATEPFNEIEKLKIILDALDLGLVSPPKMQEQSLENIALAAGEVRFVDEAAPGGSHSYRLDDLEKSTHIAATLEDIVRQIRALL